jgi:type I restriction enzyme, S subunit
MAVKPGYKQTEVGVIPKDWETRSGENLTTLIGKGASPRWQGFSYTESGMLFVTSENVRDGYLDIREPKFFPLAFHEKLKRTKLYKGDVLINLVGASIGRSCQIRDELGEANVNQAVAVFRVKDQYCSSFLAYCFQSPMTVDRILEMQVDAARPNISLSDLRRFLIPLPPTRAEQESIAEALSDADALIESFEQLIVKKRDLKQGAMQELLAGKRRLPGFEVKSGYKQTEFGLIPQDWETPELGGILKSMQLGGNYKNSEFQTNWPLIKMGNLGRGSINLERLEFIHPSQRPAIRDRLRNEDVIFNTRNTLDLVGKVAIWREELPEAYFNSNIMRMEFNETRVSSKRFMNFMLNTPQLLKRLHEIAIGTTSVAAIYRRDLVKVIIPLPPNDEQHAIADILSDMDAEIVELEAKLAKARNIKQGMMQELLTGGIRLV